jgi:hypothetical protein
VLSLCRRTPKGLVDSGFGALRGYDAEVGKGIAFSIAVWSISEDEVCGLEIVERKE